MAKKSKQRKMLSRRPAAGKAKQKIMPSGGGQVSDATSLLMDINYATTVDKFLKLYRRYQLWVWAAGCVIVVASLTLVGFGYAQQKSAEKVSDEFYQLVNESVGALNASSNASSGNNRDAADLLEFALRHDHGATAGYGAVATLMALQILGETQNKNDYAEQQKKLAIAIAQNPKLKTLHALRTADEKTLRDMVVGATDRQNLVFINLALADRLVANGKKNEAKKILQDIALNNQNNLFGLLAMQLLPSY